jgi:ankyrin repeat protein
MSYSEFDTPWVENPLESAQNALRDEYGTRLYENDLGDLLFAAIRYNDIPRLKQYLSVYSPRLDMEQKVFDDPLCIVASQGRTEVLRVLIDYYNTNWKQLPLYQRKCSLLTAACGEAHIETARLIIDSQPALNSAHIDQLYRDEALLVTARALGSLPPSDRGIETPAGCCHWVSNRTAQGEELICLLLDSGASAQATESLEDSSQPMHCFGTVLGRASSRAGPALVKRLIGQGANVHAREEYQLHASSRLWDLENPSGVTALHISSAYWNSEVLQTLLDHSGRTAPEELLCRDSNGRLPLHWAAAGPGSWECWLPDEKINKRILDTLKLLCSGSDINARDNGGKTPLHHAIRGHACCGQSIHIDNMLKFFLEKGAYAGLIDDNNQTVLHMMAIHCLDGDPINSSLMQMLISRGAEINQQDVNGNTALHLMARNLRQTKAAQSLISQGADVSLINVKGNTALHECLSTGTILQRQTASGAIAPTVADRRKALDEMINILLHIGGDAMMDQTNQAGETPRQLQSKKLAHWQKLGLREATRHK